MKKLGISYKYLLLILQCVVASATTHPLMVKSDFWTKHAEESNKLNYSLFLTSKDHYYLEFYQNTSSSDEIKERMHKFLQSNLRNNTLSYYGQLPRNLLPHPAIAYTLKTETETRLFISTIYEPFKGITISAFISEPITEEPTDATIHTLAELLKASWHIVINSRDDHLKIASGQKALDIATQNIPPEAKASLQFLELLNNIPNKNNN